MGINRNIVECKYYEYVKKLTTDVVLIETLWNVNMLRQMRQRQAIIVLIETLWNVNVHRIKEIFSTSDCINRNIVECK